jgi:hypothetical protein
MPMEYPEQLFQISDMRPWDFAVADNRSAPSCSQKAQRTGDKRQLSLSAQRGHALRQCLSYSSGYKQKNDTERGL